MKRDRLGILGIGFALLSAGFFGCGGRPADMEPVNESEIESHIRCLSDDLLEGRAVGSKGIGMAELYVENLFKTFGLEAPVESTYRQSFLLKASLPDPNSVLEFSNSRGTITPVPNQDFVINSEREDLPEETSGDLVYCGYLIQAPERSWDDIKGVDLRGKVLLCEINEPGNFPGGSFDGEDMTYHGRWTAKYEKAAELGAAGVLIIHNAGGAAYDWDVVRNSWTKEQCFLPDKNPVLYFQGWLSGDTADAVFAAAGKSRAELLAAAETPGFVPVPLGLKTEARLKPSFRTISARNIVGLIRGKHRQAKDRTIILTAHHDHLGKDDKLEGDKIYNGAVDNCSASAAMLALAAYYAQRPEALKVNLLFASVTAEEQGLLGSDYLARHLPVTASSVLANINFEMVNVWGETEDVFAIGARHSELDEICGAAAASLGLRYIPERNGPLGFFFRSDQFSFARAGIPSVWLHQGIVARGEDKGRVQARFEEYKQSRYHKVSDEIEKDWDYGGALQIIHWAREIIQRLESIAEPPGFKSTSQFQRKS